MGVGIHQHLLLAVTLRPGSKSADLEFVASFLEESAILGKAAHMIRSRTRSNPSISSAVAGVLVSKFCRPSAARAFLFSGAYWAGSIGL